MREVDPFGIGKGVSGLMYGEFGFGKTYSLFDLMLIGRTLIFYSEEKSHQSTLRSWCEANGKDEEFVKSMLTIIKVGKFTEIMPYLAGKHNEYLEGEHPYMNMGYDNLSFTMKICRRTIQQKRFAALQEEYRKDNKKMPKHEYELKRYDLIIKDWGVLASEMHDMTNQLVRFTEYGVNVWCTAHKSNSRKDEPAFMGKDFKDDVSGYFDLIGMVEARYTDEDEPRPKFPPTIDFRPGLDHIARCSSSRILKANQPLPLNLPKIIEVA